MRRLKNVRGGIKYGLTFLPLAAAIGGTGTFIWLACHGLNYYNKAFEEVRESPVIQEVIDSDTEILKEQLENKEITMQEYQDKISYWDSEENLSNYLKSDKEGNKYYLDKIKKGSDMATAGIALSLLYPFVTGFGSSVFYGSELFDSFIESAKNDWYDAKQMKDEERRKREYDDYKEELE